MRKDWAMLYGWKMGACMVLAVLLLAGCATGDSVPESHTELEFQQQVQWPEYDIRTLKLDNGVRLFLLEDHELPLVHMSVTMRSGEIEVPEGKEGLARIAAEAWRNGGSENYPGPELNTLLENRAAEMDFSFSLASGEAGLSCLREDLGSILPVFRDVLVNPRFPRDKISLAKRRLRTSISRRNDEQGDIAIRKFKEIIYGRDSVYARVPEFKAVERIERSDLLRFQEQAVRGGNLYVSLVGDFDSRKVKKLLRQEFSRIPSGGPKELSFPRVDFEYESATYFVHKAEVNQTFILMGHIGDYRDNPDYPELQVLNEVLSGGFSGRLFRNIRSERGLAYSVFGRYGCNYFYPGMFFVGLKTESGNTAQAVDAVRKELLSIRSEGVSEQELQSAKDRFLNSLIFRYDTPEKVLQRRVYYEYRGMDKDSLRELVREVKGVSREGVQRVARQYLKPKETSVLLVGNRKELQKELSALGEVRELELSP